MGRMGGGHVRRCVAAIAITLVVGSAAACSVGYGCDDYAAAGLNVFVVDASGDAICDAAVTATDGDYVEVLRQESAAGCGYTGAWERAGDYNLRIAAMQGTDVVDVDVQADRCHVKPAVVTVPLPG